MSFKATAIVTAVVTFVLGAGYILAGKLLVARWDIEPTESVLLFGRRIGAAYLGLAVIFWLARMLAPSPARSALAAGAIVTCSVLVSRSRQQARTRLHGEFARRIVRALPGAAVMRR